MEFFARRFSLRVRPKDWRRKVNENRHKPLLENSKLREHILSLNQPEQELYERVQGLYGRLTRFGATEVLSDHYAGENGTSRLPVSKTSRILSTALPSP